MLLSGGKKKQKRNQNKEGAMQGYLFGLGVMIVAGRDHKGSHKYSRFNGDA